jgi:CHAT domain-containing protein/tetratricopeptide (TPR) repeat protein
MKTGFFLFVFFMSLMVFPHPALSENSESQATSLSASQNAIDQAAALHQKALTHLDQGNYREALAPAQKALQLREASFGKTHLDIAQSLHVLGLVYHHLGDIEKARSALTRALLIRKELKGPQSPEVAESLTHLARVLVSQSDYIQAQDLMEHALEIRKEQFGQEHVAVAETLMYLAMVQGLQMNLGDALANQARAVEIFDLQPQAPPIEHSMALTSYGVILGRNGEFAKGKPFIERALMLQEEALGPTHPIVARTLDNLADLESKMGGTEGAISLAERALQIREDRLGQDHPETAASLNTVGTLFWKQGNLQEAAQYFQRALGIIEQTVGTVHPVVAANLLSLGEVQRQIGDLRSAHEKFIRALKIQEDTLGSAHNDVATTLTRLAWVATGQGNHGQAAELLDRAIRIRRTALGDIHPDLALLLNEAARVKHRQGKLVEARPYYEEARQIYLAGSRLNQDLDDVTFSRLHHQGLASLQDYALLLAQLFERQADSSEASMFTRDGFVIAEQARGWLVQSAVAKAMARKQARHSVDVELAKQLDDFRRRRQKLWGTLHTLYGKPSLDAAHAQKVSAVKKEVRKVQSDLESGLVKLETSFPKYADLAFPKPLDLPSVQELLEPGEALVSLYVWEQVLQIWVLRAGQPPVWHTAPIAKKDVVELVKRIRASLGSQQRPFDVKGAHQLYQWLFKPVESSLRDVQHLIIIPDENLLPLPFGVLIPEAKGSAYERLSQLPSTERFQVDSDIRLYAEIEWFIKHYSLTVVPSASAFKLLRQSTVVSPKGGNGFLGFGDPTFSGSGRKRGGIMVDSQESKIRFDQLRMMNALPGTRRELMAIAQTLGVDPTTHVFLREHATEAQVRHLLKEGRLGSTPVISFATHGLLAGQLSGLTEPALVLTIPEIRVPEDNGLLTMSEILDFQLPQVEWVILSACNTAGGDGSGQGLTGLARAFFFAGAKALLVSHWSVDDHATEVLMTEIFRLIAQEKAPSKSSALQQGMLAVMGRTKESKSQYFAHPYAWAPFFLVGNGR